MSDVVEVRNYRSEFGRFLILRARRMPQPERHAQVPRHPRHPGPRPAARHPGGAGMRPVDATPALWHPFADMGRVESERMVISRAEGSWVWDDAGRRYLDATAALWYSNLGHGRAEIADAVYLQMRRLDAYSIFGDYANEPALELADRLAALAPVPGSRVFLGSGGGDVVDTAAKIARAYHAQRGEPGRVHLIGRTHGYHGTHGIGTSIGGIAANSAGFGTLIADTSTVADDEAAALEREI